jgi:hypothetical protein
VEFLRILLGVAAIVSVGVYLFVAISRIDYPFELDWLEGGSLCMVARLLNGKGLYVAPSMEFVPFNYTPGYYWLAALVAGIVGPGLPALRAVAFAASLGCIGLVFVIARRHAGSPFAGFLAAGFYAATFRHAGAWFDVARPDSLLVLLLLLAAFLSLGRDGIRWQLGAALAFVAAFAVKQNALAVAVVWGAGLGYANRFAPKRFLPVAVLLAAGCVGFVAVLSGVTGGWFWYYVFRVPSHHPFLPRQAWWFWTSGLAGTVPVACAFALFLMLDGWFRPGRSTLWVAVALGAGAVLAAFLPIVRAGYANNLMPLMAALALAFGIGFCRLERAVADRPSARFALCLASILQFGVLAYPVSRQIPSTADRISGFELVQRIGEHRGDVFVPSHGYLAMMAGKEPHAHMLAMTDVMRDPDSPVARRLDAEIDKAIRSGRFDAILLDQPWREDAMCGVYVPAPDMLSRPDAFFPATGMRTRPSLLYVRDTHTSVTKPRP